jgi:FdhD protein
MASASKDKLFAHEAQAAGGIDVPVVQIGRAEVSDTDRVAIEEPLEIRLKCPAGERQIAVTMRTPGHDQELALGFLFTEGILKVGDDLGIAAAAEADREAGNIITIETGRAVDFDDFALERNFYMTSSCGVCGKAALDAIRVRAQFPASDESFRIERQVIAQLPAQLLAAQEVFAGTGGIHGAALFDPNGLVGQVFEDVGRHNAVDKLIGASLSAGQLPVTNLGLLVSGRASFELVQKASLAGCPMLAAVGAPSSLAIDLAWEANMTLIGFLRDGRFNIYTGPDRVLV